MFTEIDCESSQKIGVTERNEGDEHGYYFVPPRHLSHYQTSIAFTTVTVVAGVAAIIVDRFLYLLLSATPMARRRGTKKDLQMTQRFLYYNLKNTATSPGQQSGRYEDSHYIDIAAGLSAINRRLYRQGRQYHIANISLIDTQGDTKVRFCTLPQVWTTSKAHKLVFDAWKDQRARALENAPSDVTGRWADFKVYMSQQHAKESRKADGKPEIPLLPSFSDLDAIPDGEWEYSDVSYIKSGSEKSNQALWMMGDHISNGDPQADGVGVLTALQEMLSIPPESPILPSSMENSVVMSMNPSTGTDNSDTLANIMDDNDLAPYATTRVLGAQSTATNTESLVVRELGWSAQGIASLPAMGFPVPLGLLEVRQDDKNEGNTVGLIVELVPGEYKGVHAEAF